MAKRPTTRSKATDPATAAPAPPKPKRVRTAAAGEQAPAGPPASGPTDEEIRDRAYQRYLQRGSKHGRHFDDWLEAEKELRRKK